MPDTRGQRSFPSPCCPKRGPKVLYAFTQVKHRWFRPTCLVIITILSRAHRSGSRDPFAHQFVVWSSQDCEVEPDICPSTLPSVDLVSERTRDDELRMLLHKSTGEGFPPCPRS